MVRAHGLVECPGTSHVDHVKHCKRHSPTILDTDGA